MYLYAGSGYQNSNADEDDEQLWDVQSDPFHLVDEGGKKRIRLKFTMTQRGQNTLFYAIN